jgi:hypothetical protein
MYERQPAGDPDIKFHEDPGDGGPPPPSGNKSALVLLVLILVLLVAGGFGYRYAALKYGLPWIDEGSEAPAVAAEKKIEEQVAQVPEVQTNLKATGRSYINRASRDVCPDGIRSRILIRDEILGFITREDCKEIPPKTFNPNVIEHTSHNRQVVIMNRRVFDLEENAERSTMVYCQGPGANNIPIETSIMRMNASGDLLARLSLVNNGRGETVEAPVKFEKKQRMDAYTTASQRTESPPRAYYQLSIANINGWVGFLTYSLEFAPSSQTNPVWRNEDKLNLANCYLP